MATVYINGRYLPEKSARVPVTDPALQWGVGLFEVVRAYDRTPYCLTEHVARMKRSARTLGLEIVLPALERVIPRLLERNKLRGGYVRFTVTGTGHRWVEVRRWDSPDTRLYRRGAKLFVVDWERDPRSPINGHKTLNYLEPMSARVQAERRGAIDAVLRGPGGSIQEGSRSNVFAVQGGNLLTPPRQSGLLPGITRQAVMKLARTAGVGMREMPLTIESLTQVDELFITSTMLEVMPIRRIDDVSGALVKNKTPGPVTRALQEAYKNRVLDVCGPRAYDDQLRSRP